MRHVMILGMAIAAYAAVAWSPRAAQAGIPIVYGTADKIVRLGTLPKEAADSVEQELHKRVELGYFYQRFQIYWLDFWTWDGKHVLFAGDEYWELEPDQWSDLLGDSKATLLKEPFLYNFPPGLIIVCAIGVMCTAASWRTRRRMSRATSLLNDPRYPEAMRRFFELMSQSTATEQGPAPSASGKAMMDAVQVLRQRGIPLEEAEENLKFLVGAAAKDPDRFAYLMAGPLHVPQDAVEESQPPEAN